MKQPLQWAVVPRIALFFVFSFSFITHSFSQQGSRVGRIVQQVQALKQKGVFSETTALFKPLPAVTDPAVAAALKKYSFTQVQGIEKIQQQKPAYLKFTVPVGSSELEILLYQDNISPNGFTLKTEKGTVGDAQQIANYRGCINNDPASLAALTFANGEVYGFISNSQGNYIIGQSGTERSRHIIYNDADVIQQVPFDCGTNTFLPQSPASLARTSEAAAVTNKCVKWYWETDYDLFVNKGSLAAVTAYVQGVFNQMSTLYANDGMTMVLKTLFVWTTEDPYTGTSTSGYLTQFGNYRTSFDGDLAHLIGLKGGGGIAWINGLCKTNKYRMAYSGISASYQNVPNYSWTVECITHEQGHLLGSQHTHDCAWNGNNTKIDGCGDAAGYSSGTCAVPTTLPAGNGTIMSYCHLTSAGINFNAGFGPQPAERMINTINAASCVTACTTCTVPAQPAAITGTATVCGGSSQTYAVAAVAGAASYSWALPSGWTGNSTTNSITVTAGAAGGNISVIAVNSCGSSTARTVAVTVSSAIAAPAAITGSAVVCPASSQIYTAATVAGAASYTWLLPSGWTGTSTTSSITVTVGAAGGNISVSANSSCGSSAVRTLAVTTSSAVATPATVTGNTSVCPGTSQIYSASPVAGATSYTWTLPSGWTGSSSTNSINSTAGTSGGNITVRANSSCGQSAVRSIAVTITSIAPAQAAAISGSINVCAGSSQTYTVPLVTGAASYSWTLPPGWSGSSTTNSITVTAGSAGGNIAVASVNGCGAGSARIAAVSVSPLPSTPGAITVSGGSATVCTGNTRTYTTPLVSGLAYTWTVPAGATIVNGQGTNSINVNFTSSFVSGSSISVRSANTCGSSASRSVAVSKSTLATPGAISGNSSSCPNRYRQYSVAAVTGATSYTWTIPSGSGFWGSSTGRTVWVRLGSSSGNITVKAVSACGTSAAVSKYITITCTSGIEPEPAAKPAVLYPNPARDIANVQFYAAVSEIYTVSVIDITGRTLSKKHLNAVAGVNVQSLKIAGYLPGHYMVTIQGRSNKETVQLIIR